MFDSPFYLALYDDVLAGTNPPPEDLCNVALTHYNTIGKAEKRICCMQQIVHHIIEATQFDASSYVRTDDTLKHLSVVQLFYNWIITRKGTCQRVHRQPTLTTDNEHHETPPFVLIMRGYIQSCFQTSHLKTFIKKLYSDNIHLIVYVHTWNTFYDNPYNPDNPDNSYVTEDTIYEYFGDISHIIKHVIIDATPSPDEIYGIWSIVAYVKNVHSGRPLGNVLNLRFDIMQVFASSGYNQARALCVLSKFVKKHIKTHTESLIFTHLKKPEGSDYCFFGTIHRQYTILNALHSNCMGDITQTQTGTNHKSSHLIFETNRNDLKRMQLCSRQQIRTQQEDCERASERLRHAIQQQETQLFERILRERHTFENERRRQRQQQDRHIQREKLYLRTNGRRRCTVSVVVSRYAESIQWADELPSGNVVIYNKAGDRLQSAHAVVCLPNVGREGHTFYTHIVNNYDTLPDYTFFLQGNPFDHCPKLMDVIHRITQKIVDTHTIVESEIGFYPLSHSVARYSLDGCPQHPGLPLRRVFQTIFKTDTFPKEELVFYPGGQFAVSKRNILLRPKSMYETIVAMLETGCDPIEGYVVERFHPLIFSVPPSNRV